MTPQIVIDVTAPLVGACAGSFAATAAVRMTRQEAFIAGRSHCDHCGIELGMASTVPVLSFVMRRGVCGACGGRIDLSHPIGEVAGAGIALAAVLVAPLPRAVLIAALGLVLLTAGIVDAKTKRLPDVLTAAAALLAAGLAAEAGWDTLIRGLIAGALAFGVLEIVRRVFERARGRPGLGFGDVKLMGALAIWLGLLTPWAVVVGSALGLGAFAVVRPRDGRIAFGPALAAGAMIVGLLGEARLWPQP